MSCFHVTVVHSSFFWMGGQKCELCHHEQHSNVAEDKVHVHVCGY